MVVDKKARAFVKMIKTWQCRQPALPRAFPGEKHEIARAFYVKYDQNYGLWSHFVQVIFSPSKCDHINLQYLNRIYSFRQNSEFEILAFIKEQIKNEGKMRKMCGIKIKKRHKNIRTSELLLRHLVRMWNTFIFQASVWNFPLFFHWVESVFQSLPQKISFRTK